MPSFNVVFVVERCGCARLSFRSMRILNVGRYLFGRDYLCSVLSIIRSNSREGLGQVIQRRS
jgi:hypothetical protein